MRKELVKLGFSRQVNRKVNEGSKHPDRNAQCEHINGAALAGRDQVNVAALAGRDQVNVAARSSPRRRPDNR